MWRWEARDWEHLDTNLVGLVLGVFVNSFGFLCTFLECSAFQQICIYSSILSFGCQ